MKNTSQSAKTFSRRSFVIGALQLGLLGVLGGRLAWLQLVEGTRYKTLSDKNRINIKMLAPSRGQIYDRFGEKLAVNEQSFRVLIVREQAKDIERSLRALQKLIALDENDINRVLKESRKVASFLPLEVKDGLTWEEVSTIEVNLPDLPGLSIDTGEVRSYPYGISTAHIVGYVSSVNSSEVGENPLFSLPGFKTGKTGIEKYWDERMRGKAGASQVEVNAFGRGVRELGRRSSETGDDVTLHLDMALQEFVQKRLDQEKSASAVIMDAFTGGVYALASSPGFDPNGFTKGLSATDWEALLSNSGHPLTNKAVAGQYPPASTFKMVTALAALEEEVITKDTRVYCPGHFDFGGNRFHCWDLGGHGSVDVVAALAESCDTFFYKVSIDLGIEKIAAMARRLGLGMAPNFDLPEARMGLMPDKNWKMGHFGKPWRTGETIVASIGQSYILSTPLQLAVMTARLVNGGLSVEPSLTAYIGKQAVNNNVWPELGFKKEHLEVIKKGMDRVVNHSTGTAQRSKIETPGMEMGGKTGTAQVKRITMAQRLAGFEPEDLPWQHRHHALFVGYAPVSDPRYICSVVIEHGGSGSGVAAPLARDLLIYTQQRDPAKTKVRITGQGAPKKVGENVALATQPVTEE